MKIEYVGKAKNYERIIAFFIDVVSISIIYYIYMFLSVFTFMKERVENTSLMDNFDRDFGIMEISFTLIYIVLWLFKDIFKGKSPGKRLSSIAIAKADNPYEVPEKWQLIVRNLPFMLVLIFPIVVIAIIESIVVLVHPDNRRIGDIIAKTKIVKEKGFTENKKNQGEISIKKIEKEVEIIDQ